MCDFLSHVVMDINLYGQKFIQKKSTAIKLIYLFLFLYDFTSQLVIAFMSMIDQLGIMNKYMSNNHSYYQLIINK